MGHLRNGSMTRPGIVPSLEFALVVGAPLALALVELVHPHVDDLVQVDLDTWLFVHYAQLILFPLSAVAIAMLVRGRHTFADAMCRMSMFVFGVSFIAFDTTGGLVTGILVEAARASGAPDAWRPAIESVWMHPVLGGRGPVYMATIGNTALIAGACAAAFSLKRSGAAWIPSMLLALSSSGMSLFNTHAWPGGPLTFGGIALASAWLLWERGRGSAHARASAANAASVADRG